MIHSTNYYVVNSGLESSPLEYRDLESAIVSTNFLAIKVVRGYDENTSQGKIYRNWYKEYELHFIVNGTDSDTWIRNNWQFKYITNTKSGSFGFDRQSMEVSFTSPDGQIKRINGQGYDVESNLYHLLKLFAFYSEEKDMKTAELKQENSTLKDKIEELENTISELRNEKN